MWTRIMGFCKERDLFMRSVESFPMVRVDGRFRLGFPLAGDKGAMDMESD
jgi:hypothetical protein